MEDHLPPQKTRRPQNIQIRKINWEEYADIYSRIRRSTLLQSPVYANMARQVYKQTSIPFLFEKDAELLGIFSVQEASLFQKAIHAVILDRGPLWWAPNPGQHDVQAFFEAFNAAYPLRFGRKRRILPELDLSPRTEALLNETGLRKLTRHKPYQTIWLDISPSLDTIRGQFHGKWRNALNKAERASDQNDLCVSWSTDLKEAALVLAAHGHDQRIRGYKTTSLNTLSILCQQAALDKALLSGIMRENGKVIAGVILIRHGLTATYQVGWNALAGRDVNANYLLLWGAIKTLKTAGVNDIDLGGVNDEDAAGVKRFKAGMGGVPVELVGQYK